MSVYTNPDPDESDRDRRPFLAVLRGQGAMGTLWWLTLLAGAIIALTLIANRCGDDDADDTAVSPTATATPAADAASATIRFDGDRIVVTGSVADEPTRTALLAAAADAFPDAGIADELTVDPDADGTTVTLEGTADGAAADSLVAALASGGLGVDDRLERVPPATGSPAAIVGAVDGESIVLTGSVPDGATRDAVVAAAESALGAGNVTDRLDIAVDATADGATITLTGTAPDAVAERLVAGLDERVPALAVDDQLERLAPAALTGDIDGASVTLDGTVPDEAVRTSVVAAAAGVVGTENVSDRLGVDPSTTITGMTITLTGSAEEATARALADALADAAGGGGGTVSIDDAALAVVASDDVVADLNELFRLNPVQFATGSADILPESRPVLDQVVAALADAPALALDIEGHTDSTGDAAQNQELSLARARSVLDYLVDAGIADARLSAAGFGANRPIADNDTDAGRQQNRRIEFVIADR